VLIGYQVYAYMYFASDEFRAIKRRVKSYAEECNALNGHLRGFKTRESKIRTVDTGSAQLTDSSEYNYQRNNWSKSTNSQLVHECSASVCKSAKSEPFKYLCKYFNIKPDEARLGEFEEMLNDFAAADQGKLLLTKQKQQGIDGVSSTIPVLIKLFSAKRIERELGFEPVETAYYSVPLYTFQYISAGGKSAMSTDIRLDLNNLERFIAYLGDKVKFTKSAAGQRSLMTRLLREAIKQRDSFTCQACGNSIQKEPNLLLEIDHVIPVSKGGITSEDNLQTLCWKCNRSKGAKIISLGTKSEEVKKPLVTVAPSGAETPEQMYETARALNAAGKTYEAMSLLTEIVDRYPSSKAAEVARKLLNRGS
jgi:hypothetical protein